MSFVKQNWIELSSIQLGGALCLPIILIGHEVAKQSGLGAAIMAILIGNGLLFGLSIVASLMSVESRKTTAENAERYFGKEGKIFFALVIAISLACWFAIQTQVMSRDIVELARSRFSFEIPEMPLNALLAAVMVGCAFFGIQGVSFLANITLPLMVATLGVATWFHASYSEKSILTESIGGFSPAGISLIMAGIISAIVDLPTFFRHAASKKDALITSCVTFLIGIPLVELVGVMLGYWASSSSLTESLVCFDMPLFQLWVCLFIVFAGWTTNNTNFYSAAMSLTALSKRISEKKSYLIMGALSIALSLMPMLEKLPLVLDCMGIFVASMGGVVLTGYCLMRSFGERILDKRSQKIAWLMGVVGGILNIARGELLSPIAILDALIISSAVLIVLRMRLLVAKEPSEELYEICNER